MNRYNLKPSKSAQATAKEREFQTAWYTMAKVYDIIEDTINADERKTLKLALNMDEFNFHGSHSAFYDRKDIEHFHVMLTFGYTDCGNKHNPKYSVTLYIKQILSLSKGDLKKEILKQVEVGKQKYSREYQDPDIEINFGRKIPRNQVKKFLFDGLKQKEEAREAKNKQVAQEILDEEDDWLTF